MSKDFKYSDIQKNDNFLSLTSRDRDGYIPVPSVKESLKNDYTLLKNVVDILNCKAVYIPISIISGGVVVGLILYLVIPASLEKMIKFDSWKILKVECLQTKVTIEK